MEHAELTQQWTMQYKLTIVEGNQTTRFRFQGDNDAMASLLTRLEGPARKVSLTTTRQDDQDQLPLLLAPSHPDEIPTQPIDSTTWLVWNRLDHPAVQDKAYEQGALSVLSSQTTTVPMLAAIHNAAHFSMGTPAPHHTRFTRQFEKGVRVHLEGDRVITIKRGVIRCTSIHPDGSEVLIGFYGPGDVLMAHDDHVCHVEMTAHTTLSAEYEAWPEVSQRQEFHTRLKERICQMELWSSMQARPVLEERLLGVLQVAAGKFSRQTDEGALMTIKITHEQLASAIGATRTTVTRLLGKLRKSNRVQPTRTPNGEFLLIKDFQFHCH